MPFVATTITIPESIYPILVRISNSRTLPACQIQRAKIVLLASDGLANAQISKQLGISHNSVSKWRLRFRQDLPVLETIAKEDSENLEKAVSRFLKYGGNPSPSRPLLASFFRENGKSRILYRENQ